MKLVLRAETQPLRRGFSFLTSGFLHFLTVTGVLLWPALPPEPGNAYSRQIRAHQIVWYSLREPLPEIAPPEKTAAKPLRARLSAPHNLVAGKKDSPKPPQLIWTPAPAIETSQMLASPNIVALARPARPVRSFQADPVESARTTSPPPALPSAPELAIAMAARPVSTDILPPAQPARRTFVPPVEATHRPNVTPQIEQAPEALNRTVTPELAIVGLFPERKPEIPVPKVSQQAGFSAGPQQHPDGQMADATPSQLVVPGLLAHNEGETRPQALLASLESPTSRKNLLAAAHLAGTGPSADAPTEQAVRVSNAPDPRLEGRLVYALAIQMPNITSYTGSWIVWFAEHEPIPGQAHPLMRAPVPVRKVDPKYVPAAVEERIEGKVRLAAIIRKDGRVDSVEVVRNLDERLDRSAGEALAKWEFEPAMRDGMPIDVDAIFEIPFRLAPRASR